MLFQPNNINKLRMNGIQKIIWKFGVQMTPISISLSDEVCQKISSELASSCRAYFEFISQLLNDFFHDPNKYGIISVPHFDILFSALRDFSTVGQIQGNMLYIPRDKMEEIRISCNNRMGRYGFRNFDLLQYLQVLQYNGFIIAEKNDGFYVENKQFSNMFPAYIEMSLAMQADKKMGKFNFDNLDFRMLNKKFLPQYEDVTRILPDDIKIIADEINNYFAAKKIKPVCYAYWKMNYKYKSKRIMSFDTDRSSYSYDLAAVRTPDKIKSIENEIFDKAIESDYEGYKNFYLDHLSACRGCSTGHIGAQYEVFGTYRRVCAGIRLRGKYCYEPYFTDYFKKFIDIAIQQADVQ